MELSSLRIVGLIVGVIGFYITFTMYRGPRWKRKNFVISGLFSFSLAVVSINPDVLNQLASILQLEMEQRGRILALLIGSNIMLWFLLVHYKTRLDEYRYQFDLLIRKLGHEEIEDLLKRETANKEIMVIIPAYNEGDNLKVLLPKIPETVKEKNVAVLIVDDGSSDDTKEVALQAGHLVAQNKINRGQGAASRLGYDVLLRNNIQIGVTMDADNQHLPEEIEKLVTPILNNEFDLVIGSRILGESFKSSALRDAGINVFTKIINAVTGTKLTDCSSGYRAFNVDKISLLNLREDQFQTAEVIVEAAKKGLRIGEVPITIVERQHGTSKKGHDIRYGLFFAKTILKSWWR